MSVNRSGAAAQAAAYRSARKQCKRLRKATRIATLPSQQRNKSVTYGVDGLLATSKEVTMRGFIIGVLVVAVGVLGYLYWDSQQNTLFKAPGVEIKKS